jgi:hypothetical protein
MRRILGLLFTIAGGIAILWSAYYIMTGHSSTMLKVTDTFAVSAMTSGLAGAAFFTVGLLWIRE